MGLFNWWTARQAEADARAATARRITEIMEMAREDEQDDWQQIVSKNLDGAPSRRPLSEESSVIVNTRAEGGGWEILGSAWKGHIARDQQVMVAMARRFFRFDPNCQAAVYGLLDYLMGRGVVVTPKSKDPRIWKLWRNFWSAPENNMDVRQFEMFKRVIRDGETFLRFFSKDKAGAATAFTTVRFMDPIDVQRGANEGALADTDKTNQGIVFDPNDAETPIAYYMKDRINPGKEHKIDASEVVHVKYPVADMDQARGESALQAIMDLFTHYKQWLKNRIILNKLRTAIFAVRKIDLQAGQTVNALSQTLPGSGRGTDGDNKKQNIRAGTLYTPPPGVDIEMRAANINASDVKDDGRNMILQMAAGIRLPEFMFGDASNANYSSTMMAESPFVKHIHFLQAYFEATLWRPVFRKVVEAAVKAGKLQPPAPEDIFAVDGNTDLNEATTPPPPDDNETPGGRPKGKTNAPEKQKPEDPQQTMTESELEIFYGCDVEWPEIIHREPKDQTEALVLARDAGWVSDKTCSEKLGFDWAEEVRKQQMIEDQAEQEGNPLINRAKGQNAADAEAAAGAAQQTEEEALAAAAGGKIGKLTPEPPK